MAPSAGCVKRLQREYKLFLKDPPPHILAHPSPSNLLEWHYAILGPTKTPYDGGVYHGKIVFREDYPFSPPRIEMLTPSGRFEPQTRLCLSMSDFHPESWNPMWCVSSILTGLASFMLEEKTTTGSIQSSSAERRHLAKVSMEFNVKNPTFRKLFPGLIEEEARRRKEVKEGGRGGEGKNKHKSKKKDALRRVSGRQTATSGENILANLALLVLCIGILVVPVWRWRTDMLPE